MTDHTSRLVSQVTQGGYGGNGNLLMVLRRHSTTVQAPAPSGSHSPLTIQTGAATMPPPATASHLTKYPCTAPGSAVFSEASLWGSYFAALKSYIASLALGALKADALVRTLLLALVHYAVFLHASAICAAFALPPAELRRIVATLDETAAPPPRASAPTIGLAVSSVAGLVLVLGSLHAIEKNPDRLGVLRGARDRVEIQTVELIDERGYREGTLAAIERLQVGCLATLEQGREELLADLDTAFEQVEGRVDPFLDWYYSLGADYARLGKLLVGDLEEYVGSQLQQHLAIGETFASLSDSFEQ